jgi:hypothetical protein
MRSRAIAAFLFAAAALGLTYAFYSGALRLPDRWNPWAPLRMEEPPNLLTRFKLARLSRDAPLCRSVLDEAGLRYQPVPDRETAPGCGFVNAVRVEEMSARIGAPFTLSCPSAVALSLWEKHVLQPAALVHFGRPVVQLEHFGSYSCRNVYGREGGRRSAHATADALDVAGFVLEGRERIRVVNDWHGTDSKGAFLREVHKGACRMFDAVLGPDYNEAHRDHLHFDVGPFRACR